MNKKIILELETPWIDCYTTYSHLLSILQGDERTHGWIFSHFINLFMNKDLRQNSWGEFYKPMPYELSFFEICKWIDIQKIRRSDVVKTRNDIIDFLLHELNLGYYIHLNIEHKCIHSFENNNHIHDALVYGIDLENGIIYAQDVFLNGKLEKKSILLDEFIDSVLEAEVPFESDYMKGSIYSYKIKQKCDYEIDSLNILNSIQNYVDSTIPEYWKLYNNANSNYIRFGIEIYDSLVEYIYNYEEGKKIDIRPFYVLKDHFIMMYKSIDYCKQICDNSIELYEEIIGIYDKLIMLSENLNLMLLILKRNYNEKKKNKSLGILKEMKDLEVLVEKKITEIRAAI